MTHGSWPLAAPGPVHDRITVGDNPQYRLVVTVPSNSTADSAVWALLTRHVTEKEVDEDEEGRKFDASGNDVASDHKDYLALHIYKNRDRALAGQRSAIGRDWSEINTRGRNTAPGASRPGWFGYGDALSRRGVWCVLGQGVHLR